jgi:hypothetical protein
VFFINTGSAVFNGDFHFSLGVDVGGLHMEMPYDLHLSNINPGGSVSDVTILQGVPFDRNASYSLEVSYRFSGFNRWVKLIDPPMTGVDILTRAQQCIPE